MKNRRAKLPSGDSAAADAAFLEDLREDPIAAAPEAANRQHYEVPSGFFRTVLGPHLKYSCGYWSSPVDTLEGAEQKALEQTASHANLGGTGTLLDLGCGWGSFLLWAAENHPGTTAVGLTNSRTQKQFIDERARRQNLDNVRVIVDDINDFRPEERFDRIVSVEMFEHMRNWPRLLNRIADWLVPDGRLLVHHFCHRGAPYRFGTEGASNWMGRHFFTGGMMPSRSLLKHVEGPLSVEASWAWSGKHYRRTCEAWLERLDAGRPALEGILEATYGGETERGYRRWRLFFLACSELFGYRNGTVWQVVHHRLRAD